MFLGRNKKINVYPCKPQFYFIKVGFKGVKTVWACFRFEKHIITQVVYGATMGGTLYYSHIKQKSQSWFEARTQKDHKQHHDALKT